MDQLLSPAFLVLTGFGCVACVLLRRLPPNPWFGRLARVLESSWLPILLGVVTAAFYWWVWGSTLNPPPVVQDEAAYLLQARIFAAGRWTAPSPPLPEFFEQFHVLVTPILAAKFPPGHSLLLVPGIWLGLPALMPLLLSGVAGALVFHLARRVAGPGVGLLAWAIWLGCSGNLMWRAGFYSELTTSGLGLLAWWALLRWHGGSGTGWLLGVAVCIGWGVETRPLTMLVFALPTAVVVLRETVRRRSWGGLAASAVTGTLVLGLTPLWSFKTTGDWKRSPRAVYTAQYMPWDRLGFGLDTARPARPLPRELAALSGYFQDIHEAYVPAAVPMALLERARRAALSAWSAWRLPLVFFALAGLLFLPQAGLVPLATALLMFEAYAAYAHKASWAVYYLEVLPVAAFLTALGIWGLSRRILPDDPGNPPSSTWRRLGLAGVLALVMVGLSIGDGISARRTHFENARGSRELTRVLATIPEPKAVVFLRFALPFDPYFSLVANGPFFDRQRIWLAHDLGAGNAELLRAAPERAGYRFDEGTGRLERLPR